MVVQILAQLKPDTSVVSLQQQLKILAMKFVEIIMILVHMLAMMVTQLIMMVVQPLAQSMMVGIVSVVVKQPQIHAMSTVEMEETTNHKEQHPVMMETHTAEMDAVLVAL